METRENGQPPLDTGISKEEFFCKYDENTINSRAFHLQLLHEIEKALLQDDVKSFGDLCYKLSYVYDSKSDSDLLVLRNDESNPFKSKNVIILACKLGKLQILKYILSNYELIAKLFSNDRSILSPNDQDETGHNAFYYCVRSESIELLQTLIEEWPNNYFSNNTEILNNHLAQAYQELKLKNILLSQSIEIFVHEKLVDLRFYSSSNQKTEKPKNLLNNIKERITLLIENIESLSVNQEVDDKFLFIAKNVAQNIHILKQQLKSTYNKLPWEEIEFCLLGIISSFTKVQAINLHYKLILTKEKIVKYLQYFSEKLELLSCNIKTPNSHQLNILPKINRDKNISNILANNPQFKDLYDDYHHIRDIHSLERMSNYIKLASSVDPAQKEGQLVIIRSLQVIGEYLKNTLESPKLSTFTSERLLLSLESDTRKIIIDLRNSLSHAYSLSRRIIIEKSSNIDFFKRVQNDMKKVGNAIDNIMYKDKMRSIKILLKNLCKSENSDEIKHMSMISKSCQLKDEIWKQDIEIDDFEKLEKLIKNLRQSIPQPTDDDCEKLDRMDKIVKEEKNRIAKAKEDYMLTVSSMQCLFTILNNSLIDQSIATTLRHMASHLLQVLKSNETKSTDLKEIVEIATMLQSKTSPENQSEETDQIIYSILHIISYEVSNVKWINNLRSKLKEKYFESQDEQILTNFERGNYDEHLAKKLCELKDILKVHSINDPVKLQLYKDKGKLQAVLEMLVLDILSILGSFKNNLENNLLFLDEKASVLVGKSLRNHLAHQNPLIDILQSDPSMSLISNARKLASEDIMQSKRKIGGTFRKDVSDVKNEYIRGLDIIVNQEKMFEALREGNFEDMKKCLMNGADIFARNLNLWTTLHFSAMSQNPENMKFLLSQGVDINLKTKNKQSPLHIAALHGSSDIVDFILKNKHLNVNELDDSGKTSLHIAAQHGHEKTVETLLKYDPKTNIKDLRGYTSLHHATERNNIGIVKALIKKDPKSEHIRALNEFTLLHIASEEGNMEIVNFLLERKVDIHSRNDRRSTAVHLAALHGRLEVLNVLISKGADVNVKNVDGCTPLHNACENGHEKIVDVLLKQKADPNVHESLFYNTPLHYAAYNGHEDIVNNLLKYGANPNAKTSDNMTPLIRAIQSGRLQITEILLKNGASLKDRSNESSLHLAISNGHFKIVELLIKYKVDIDRKGGKRFNDMTPIHIAAWNGQTEIIKLLLENKARVDVRDACGNTPLHLASRSGNKTAIEILLENKLGVNMKNGDGLSPLHIAVQAGHLETVEVLIKHNAEINSKCKHFTPLHVAALFGHTEIVDLLIKNKADVNNKGSSGMTALHIAAECGHVEIAKILIAGKAKFDIKDDFDITPLTHAVGTNQKKIIELLIANGVDVNSDNGRPLIIAVKNKYRNIINLLLKNNARVDNEFCGINPLLYYAIRNNDEETIYTLIKRGVDVNYSIKGLKPLDTAVELKLENIVEILLKNGAKVNYKTPGGITPLHSASVNKDSSNIVEILLKYGADVNLKDYDDRKPFHLAVSKNCLENVKILLQQAKIDVNEISNDFTAVQIASQEGHTEMVKLLVDKGGDMYVTNRSGTKSIHLAAREGHKNVVEFFLNQGVSVHEPGHYGQTPLHYAAMFGHIDVSKYLLQKGANVNYADEAGATPIHVAAGIANVDYVKFLLENGAFYNGYGLLTMHTCRDRKVIDMLKLTKELFEAVKQNNAIKVRNSISAGAFVNAKNTDDVTPLYFAAWKGYEDVVNILLENGGNPNVKGKKGLRPLHYAVKFSHMNIVKSLLTKGAMYNVVSDSGNHTPASFASNVDIKSLFKLIDDSFTKIENGDSTVINDLKKIKDVDVIKAVLGTVNKENRTLIAVAKRNGFKRIEDLSEISIRSLTPNVNLSQHEKLSEKTQKGSSKSHKSSGASVMNLSESIRLAEILIYQEKYAEALQVYERVSNERKRIFGPNNLETLDADFKIAEILFKQNKYNDSTKLLREIYTKRAEILGENDPSTLDTRSLLALILHYQGKNEEALQIYREVYAKQKDILKFDDSNLLDTGAHMALVLMALENYDEALKMNQEVYAIRGKLLGPHDPRTLSLKNNTAMILSKQGKYDEALKIYGEVHEVRTKVLGPSHSDTMRALQNIIGVHVMQGNLSEAIETYQNLFEKQKESLGPDHLDTLNTQHMIGNLQLQQGNPVVAYKMLTDCLPKKKAILGAYHAEIVQMEKTLATIDSVFKTHGFPDFSNTITSEDNRELIISIRNGDTAKVDNLLKKNLDVNHRDDDGRTLLHHAVDTGHIDIVKLLLKNGADITKVTNKGNTCLHTATSKENKEIVELLLKSITSDELNSFVNAKTSGAGTTALHVAAKSGSIEIVKFLLMNGAIYCSKNNEGKTPLDVSKNCDTINFLRSVHEIFLGAQKGDENIIKKIKEIRNDELKAVMNTKSDGSKSIVEIAILNQHKKLAKKLITAFKMADK